MKSIKLQQSLKAYEAVCEMLEYAFLSEQMERQLLNLKKLLELEMSALEAAEDGEEDGDGAAA